MSSLIVLVTLIYYLGVYMYVQLIYNVCGIEE